MVMPLALLLAAYFIGSIPFSWIVTRIAIDPKLYCSLQSPVKQYTS